MKNTEKFEAIVLSMMESFVYDPTTVGYFPLKKHTSNFKTPSKLEAQTANDFIAYCKEKGHEADWEGFYTLENFELSFLNDKDVEILAPIVGRLLINAFVEENDKGEEMKSLLDKFCSKAIKQKIISEINNIEI